MMSTKCEVCGALLIINKMKQVLFALLIVSPFYKTNAQEVEKYYSSWNTIDIGIKINDKWSVNSEFNIRRTDFLKKWEQFIIRPFVHYKVSKELDLAFGYSYIDNNSFSDFRATIDFKEHNIFQQLTIKHPFSKFSFQHRLRFEERFKQNIIEVAPENYIIDGTNYRNRLRYKFQVTIPLKTFASNRKLNLVLYDELHLDFEDSFRPEAIDQNRMNISLSYRINNHIKIRSGYHDIYFVRSNTNSNNRIWETKIVYTI